MRASQEEKGRSHDRIVREAARLTRERGIDRASVGDVMKAAGMTHGGFYKHFESKDALLAAALQAAFDDVLQRLAANSEEGFADLYQSEAHLEHPELGCPIPALAADIGRSSPELKEAFGIGVRRIAKAIAAEGEGSEAEREKAALRQLAMMAGALMIARASDPSMRFAVMEACRSRA